MLDVQASVQHYSGHISKRRLGGMKIAASDCRIHARGETELVAKSPFFLSK